MNWIAAEPPASARRIIAITVVEIIAFIILKLRREAERVRFGDGATGADDFPEGAVLVGRPECSVRSLHERGNVSVAIVSGEVDSVGRIVYLEQPADPAGPLLAPAQITAPHER